jgi:peptide/nickel transport system substrate-binding protein
MVCGVKLSLAARADIVTLAIGTLLGTSRAPAAAAAPARPTDLLRIPFPQYDGGLTPYTFEVGYPLMTLVYDTLLWRDTEGVPRPWLARSVQRSRGGRRLTVQLRSGVRWHDGRPVTAADVAFTFGYMADRDQPRFTPQLTDISRVAATGRLTVTFDLRRPSLGFDDQPLADVPLLPRHLWRGLPAGRGAPAGPAVGSGPYRLVRATKKGGYVLRSNTRYFRGAPRVRELRVPIIGDAEDTYEALRRRKVDMVPLGLPRTVARRLESLSGIAVRRGTSYAGTQLVMNLRRGPFKDRRARRAVAAALNLRRLVRNVAPAEAAVGGFIHPASQWAADAPVQTTDEAAARRGFAELGLQSVRILAPDNDPVRSEAGRQVVLAIRRAGGRATLVEVSSRELGNTIGEDGTPGDFDAAITSIPALVSHDPDFLRTMFGSSSRLAPLNSSGYRSAAFDAAARRVASETDEGSRRRAILAELQLRARDAPAVALFFSEGAYAYRSEIFGGGTFVKGDGILDKRSFLESGAQPEARRRDAASPTAGEDGGEDDDSAFGIINVISLIVLGIVVVLAVLAVLQRRRRA